MAGLHQSAAECVLQAWEATSDRLRGCRQVLGGARLATGRLEKGTHCGMSGEGEGPGRERGGARWPGVRQQQLFATSRLEQPRPSDLTPVTATHARCDDTTSSSSSWGDVSVLQGAE
ncbi:hypothetical protein E2C01_047510 [Portunus trituberculatus]|uniref:Uncharacterized protein n=1 Tax=Portunus trituberculatus TaxID=210409 RepID=A0A5B7G7N4_PORTR|nr:hypothetical protein [Portunus trituberculatus]